MKRFWLGFLLGALLIVALLAASSAIYGKVTSLRPEYAFPTPQAAEAGGLRVSLAGSDSREVIITRGSDSFTYTRSSGGVCSHPVITPDGRSLFLLVWSRTGYDRIIRFDFSGSPLSSAKPSRILTHSQLTNLFGGKPTWVNSVYKASPAGDRLLMNISTEDTSPNSPGTTFSERPYWYDITNNSVREPDG